MPEIPYILLISSHENGVKPSPGERWDADSDLRLTFPFWGNPVGIREATEIIRTVCDADAVGVSIDELVRDYKHADGSLVSWMVVRQDSPEYVNDWYKEPELRRA